MCLGLGKLGEFRAKKVRALVMKGQGKGREKATIVTTAGAPAVPHCRWAHGGQS